MAPRAMVARKHELAEALGYATCAPWALSRSIVLRTMDLDKADGPKHTPEERDQTPPRSSPPKPTCPTHVFDGRWNG
eukprot:4812628-Pyramimonas_sp.AAC.1